MGGGGGGGRGRGEGGGGEGGGGRGGGGGGGGGSIGYLFLKHRGVGVNFQGLACASHTNFLILSDYKN